MNIYIYINIYRNRENGEEWLRRTQGNQAFYFDYFKFEMLMRQQSRAVKLAS